MKKLFSDFKHFCSKGNILELATGVMIGGAFSTIVTSLVNDLLMPLIGLLTGGIDLSGLFIPLDLNFGAYASIDAAKNAGVGTLNYGAFLQSVINFLIIAFCIFLLVKAMNKLMPRKEEKKARQCPFCQMEVHDKATRCPHCGSDISDSVVKE